MYHIIIVDSVLAKKKIQKKKKNKIDAHPKLRSALAQCASIGTYTVYDLLYEFNTNFDHMMHHLSETQLLESL